MSLNKGVKIRLIIHHILYEIYKHNKTLNNQSIIKYYANQKEEDYSFINNVSLNSMRYFFHCNKIISSYIKKKPKINELILLISAITQIVYLDFKEYAVINCSVEIAKKLNIYHGFVNAFLRKVSSNKVQLKNIDVNFKDLPNWFLEKTKNFNKNNKNIFIKNYCKEPSLHIVFKNKNNLISFQENIIQTSNISGFLTDKKKINEYSSFKKGDWWVQDFSSFLPISGYSYKNTKEKFIDLCAAPGGKAFQVLSQKKDIILNDKSTKRIKILQSNLKRLRLKTKIMNIDALKINNDKKYDFIILDSPCSAVGTIRRNPEIFFKKKQPDFSNLLEIQEKLLLKASELINEKGIILYMVCSFLKIETIDQVNKFLKKNKEFYLNDFYFNNKVCNYDKFIKDKYMITLPTQVNGFNVDGYFAAYIRKK